MEYFSGYGIKVKALESFDNADTGTLECHLKKDNKVVNCQHLQTNGECRNKFFYHYCKHIVKVKDQNKIELLEKYNFNRNLDFNSETYDTAVVSEKQYKVNLKDYLNESKLMFPRFSENHNNANYIALAFCEEVNDITPILVIGKSLKTKENPRFNTFYLIESQFVHYNFMIAFALRFSDILKHKESLTYGLAKNEIKVNTNDIVNSVFENPLLINKEELLRSYIDESTERELKKNELIQEKNELIQEKNELIQEKNKLIQEKNELIQEKNKLIQEKNKFTPETISLFKYLNKKWNLNSDYVKKLTSSIDQDLIYQKLKSQPESIMNSLESNLIDDSKGLVEFSLFYTLLQLKIVSQDNIERNDKVNELIERAKKVSEFASILIDLFI
jgi:hypothetical protein